MFFAQIRRKSNWCKTPNLLSFPLKLFLRLPHYSKTIKRRTLPRSLRTSVARRRRGGGRIRGGEKAKKEKKAKQEAKPK